MVGMMDAGIYAIRRQGIFRIAFSKKKQQQGTASSIFPFLRKFDVC
jgi:hypothetical protein